MSLLSGIFAKKNRIESLNIEDVKISEIQLNKKISDLQMEIHVLEERITRYFAEAASASSRSEEISIARRIDTTSKKREAKLQAQMQLEKELRALTNILILKEHEHDLQSAGVWNALGSLEPDEVEGWLVSKNLNAESHDELVREISRLTDDAMSVGSDMDEENLAEILHMIDAVKSGDLEPAGAELYIAERMSSHE